jgi:hypothetical protein
VHLHACVTDGVFAPAGDGPPAFLPARPITQADMARLAEKVRSRGVRWFSMQRLLDVTTAADMLAWENSGFSVDASVRITLIDRDVSSYLQSLEHLLGHCCDVNQKPRSHDTSRIACAKPMARVGEEFPLSVRTVAATSGSLPSSRSQGRSGRFSHTSANRASRRPSLPLVARPPTAANSCSSTTRATSSRRGPTSAGRAVKSKPRTGDPGAGLRRGEKLVTPGGG